MTGDVTVHHRLDPALLPELLALLEAATRADGMAPLGEQARLGLRRSAGPGRTVVVSGPDGALTGVAHLTAVSAELAVHPQARRRGVGRALVGALEDEADGTLEIWSHGRLPAAAALAARLGYREDRVLLQLHRELTGDLPELVLPPGVRLRAFVPGVDDAAWLAVNARAFAHHPEQGTWSANDLADRQAEPWFDPAGFLLAVTGPDVGEGDEAQSNGESVLGFHWTKVHPDAGKGGAPIGEVYVLGVDPDAQGRGLGPALTLAGLQLLGERGLRQVMLYAEESNGGAVRLYERLGFTRWSVDVTYRRRVDDTGRTNP